MFNVCILHSVYVIYWSNIDGDSTRVLRPFAPHRGASRPCFPGEHGRMGEIQTASYKCKVNFGKEIPMEKLYESSGLCSKKKENGGRGGGWRVKWVNYGPTQVK